MRSSRLVLVVIVLGLGIGLGVDLGLGALASAAVGAQRVELAGKVTASRTVLAQRRVGEARYIAISDLVPGLHAYATARQSAIQTVLILLGIAVIALLHTGHAHV